MLPGALGTLQGGAMRRKASYSGGRSVCRCVDCSRHPEAIRGVMVLTLERIAVVLLTIGG